MMNNNRAIVITGASSGLGKCLYKSFSKSYNVINISRTISASEYNIIINLNDLSGLKKKLEMNKVKHDLCILNAGTMGSIGSAFQIKDEELLEALNMFLNLNNPQQRAAEERCEALFLLYKNMYDIN